MFVLSVHRCTFTGKGSCPAECAFLGNGCFAAQGPMGWLWSGMTKAGPNSEFKNGRGKVKTIDWAKLCKEIAQIQPGNLWRHNQAGDLPKKPGTIKIDRAKVQALTRANKGKRGFTYTHHNVLNDLDNREAVREAVADGFIINLSANNPAHADALYKLGIAPVVMVLPAAQTENSTTPDGVKIVVCPATIRDDITCLDCKLCSRIRDFIIGFPAHGAGKAKAERAAA
jgi:uncharacterized protein (UPF0264 family)